MKIKKIIALVLTLSMMSSSTIIANASTADSDLPEKYVSTSITVYSNWRAKENSTSHYIYNLAKQEIRVYSYSDKGINRTVNGSAIIPYLSQRLIRNTIWERYADGTETSNRCRLAIKGTIPAVNVQLAGVWSPDSVGNYPVAN